MKRHIRAYFQFLVAVTLLFSSCAYHPDVPASSKEANCLPTIFPDYCNVTVPCNIAPLNFMLPAGEYSECVARITTPDGRQQTYGAGVKVQIPDDEWHAMLNAAKGKSIKVEVWGKTTGAEHGNVKSEWLSFSPFEIFVAEEPIDEYLSYRLIEPSYVAWNFMEIAQRNITSFEETQIFNNKMTSIDREKGQCIVYPSWHPTAKLVAFSTNKTRQGFHTLNPNKIEVYDMESDLILYDVATDSVMVVCNDSTLLEVYPTWSPDGKYLYYCKSVPLPEELRDKDIRSYYQKIQYNIYRRTFDLATRGFGEEELVYDAASQDMSATLPRISPDGHYLLFAQGHYGCFHIWHREANIVCMPLDDETPSDIDLTKLNSEGFPDSYPSWSSNGHWIMCASRRNDNNYSRVYFSYFHNGKAEKAFLLPQEDPEHHTFLLKSYNRPEFMVEPVHISVNEFSQVFQ